MSSNTSRKPAAKTGKSMSFKRVLKKSGKILTYILGLTGLLVVLVLVVDRWSTDYLDMEHHESLSTSFLMTDVNVIPMDRDTVLVNTSVLVKDGVIKALGPGLKAGGVEIIDGRHGKKALLTPDRRCLFILYREILRSINCMYGNVTQLVLVARHDQARCNHGGHHHCQQGPQGNFHAL